MKQHLGKIAVLAAGVLVLLVVTHKQPESVSITGKYVSVDDPGVLVFREDGTFSFSFGTNMTVFSENASPPRIGDFRVTDFSENASPRSIGYYRVTDSKEVRVSGLPPSEPMFTIEVRDRGESLLLTRLETNGTLPTRAVYRRQ